MFDPNFTLRLVWGKIYFQTKVKVILRSISFTSSSVYLYLNFTLRLVRPVWLWIVRQVGDGDSIFLVWESMNWSSLRENGNCCRNLLWIKTLFETRTAPYFDAAIYGVYIVTTKKIVLSFLPESLHIESEITLFELQSQTFWRLDMNSPVSICFLNRVSRWVCCFRAYNGGYLVCEVFIRTFQLQRKNIR